MAESVPAGTGDPQQLLDGALRVLAALDVRPDLIDIRGDATNCGAGVGTMLAASLGGSFGALGASLAAAVADAVKRGATCDDPIISAADLPAEGMMRSTSGPPLLFVVEDHIPPGHPLRSLPVRYLTCAKRTVCIGHPQRKFVRLSMCREWTEELERKRLREAEDERRAKEQRDAVAKSLDEAVDAAFLRRRVAELEQRLAAQQQ
jgi:hypothetical protein